MTASHTISRQVHGKRHTAVFVIMIALSDFLVFNQAPGLNLFVLSVSLVAAVLLAASKPLRPLRAAGSVGVAALAAAPLIEAPTWSGFLVAMLAVTYVALAAASLLPKRPSGIALVFLRFMPMIPTKLLHDSKKHGAWRYDRTSSGAMGRSLAGWAFTLGMALVFLLLFRAANPLIEIGLRNIDFTFLLRFLDISRLGFWLLASSFIWALVRPRLIRRRLLRPAKDAAARGTGDALFDHGALVRSLCVFNLLFALQTLLDLAYLWGGVALPAGMSYAQYAHRGAYPLVATALLAAGFVLIAMRRDGPGDRSPLIRALVMAWILQNVLLCLSSILRLDLYVEAYSLTGLRIAAGIWMWLVAAGLVFILLRIAFVRSNEWLISMNLATLLAVLYLAAFFDFSGFIARFNVENVIERQKAGTPLDIPYLASLGPSAIPALDRYLASMPYDTCMQRKANNARKRLAKKFATRSMNWRSWSYRADRMEAYLRSTALIESRNGDITGVIKFWRTPNGAPHPCRR